MSELANLIRDSFIKMMNDVHVCMPARIEKYDPDTMLCTVVPLIKRKFYRQEAESNYPPINNVPIVFSRTATALIRLPVTTGDIVTLVFADTELSNWIHGKGEPSLPADSRRHHINDCFAFVGGYPKLKPHPAVNPNALEVIVESGTKITIGNKTDDLVAIAHESFTKLSELCAELSSTLASVQLLTVTCAGAGNPSSVPINAANFATIKTNVDAVKTAVDTQVTKLGNIKV